MPRFPANFQKTYDGDAAALAVVTNSCHVLVNKEVKLHTFGIRRMLVVTFKLWPKKKIVFFPS